MFLSETFCEELLIFQSQPFRFWKDQAEPCAVFFFSSPLIGKLRTHVRHKWHTPPTASQTSKEHAWKQRLSPQ